MPINGASIRGRVHKRDDARAPRKREKLSSAFTGPTVETDLGEVIA